MTYKRTSGDEVRCSLVDDVVYLIQILHELRRAVIIDVGLVVRPVQLIVLGDVFSQLLSLLLDNLSRFLLAKAYRELFAFAE